MLNMIDLTGKVALVTGGSRGIGAACCKALAASGADVVVNYPFESEDPAAVLEEIRSAGGQASKVMFDISNSKAVLAGFEQLAERHGRLDILVNNAGIRVDNLALRMSDEQWKKCMSVNLDGVFYCCRAALALMRKSGGSIISISSIAAFTGSVGQTNYSAAKAGIIGMTNSLALEYGGRGIRVNCVVPGLVNTPMTEDLKPAFKEDLVSRIPLKRFGEPEEIANTVLFLASDLAGYISGATIHVNGGGYPG